MIPPSVTVADDDLVIDLAVAPVRVSEDGGDATVTVTAKLASGARTEATAVALNCVRQRRPGRGGFRRR